MPWAIVNNYNPLVKVFPINSLLSNTELDRIWMAVKGIFNHLGKIQINFKLVEAISRDMSSQLLKVLGTRCRMYIPYEDIVKVMCNGQTQVHRPGGLGMLNKVPFFSGS